MRWYVLLLLVLLVGCNPTRENPAISISPAQAAVGETVKVNLRGFTTDGAKLFIGGTETTPTVVDKQTLSFLVRQETPIGLQEIRVESGNQKATGALKVFGKVVANQLVVTLKPGINRAEAIKQVEALGFRFIEPFQSLGGQGTDNPCSGELGTIDIGGKPLGQALEELEKLDVVFQADPRSDWGLDAVNYTGAIGAPAAQTRGRTGKGITIAILDTGVGHPDLGNFMGSQFGSPTVPSSRILAGFNFVGNNTNVTDDFDIPDPTETTTTPAGRERYHGTIAAVMAAGGSTSPRQLGGVAPGATILPVKVCDSAGRCLASNVVKGVCYALNQVQDRSKLVLNLSLGGDTPVDVLEAILKYAIRQNVQIAAAAGNQGPDIRDGSFVRLTPKHYPAAFDIPGLVAVAALAQSPTGAWNPASFSSQGTNITYLDIAAPGADISFVFPAYNYNGTSFATPLVAGAMALWREANPTLTPVQIEEGIKKSATALPFPTNQVGAGLLNLSSQP